MRSPLPKRSASTPMSSGPKSRARPTILKSGSIRSEDGKTKLLEGEDTRYIGRQFTVSQGHPKGRDGRYHEGGSFYTVDVRYHIPTVGVSFKHPFRGESFHGSAFNAPAIIPDVSNDGIAAIRSKDLSDLDSDGASAISAIAPTNENANVAQQIGELHQDGIARSLPGVQSWKRRTEVVRAAGSEYLSAVFGWLPLKKEIENVSNTISQADQHINQYESGAGSNSRREFHYPVEETTITTKKDVIGASTPGVSLSLEWYDDKGAVLTETIHSVSRKWFVGSFTYANAPRTDSLGRIKYDADRANYLLGTTLTPNVVWELTPWSWAVDWFSNAGDVINNFTQFAQNGLVMRYGYMMEENSTTITRSINRCGLKTIGDRSVPDSQVIITSKVRQPANPFGFGLSWDGLSPSQILITTALGITRL